MQSYVPGIRGYLIDLDGTLISGRHLLPGARMLLERVGDRFVILSNDSEHTVEQIVRRFAGFGIKLEPDRVLLAGTTAIETIAQRHPRSRVMVLGSASLRRYATHAGLILEDERPDVVLVARDRRFNYARLSAAAAAVTRGAAVYLACPDTSHPGVRGEPTPEAGALAAALFACTGPVSHTVIGKPESAMFRVACARLAIEPEDGVMIGDNPLTDGAGASAIGLNYWQVAPGGLEQAIAVRISEVSA